MNLKEIEYILKIDEEKNVTRAAEKLFLTPSALNQQLLRLEQEIGVPLFNRIRNGWTRTEAGEIYLNGAREIMRIKKETYHRLQDVTHTRNSTISVGFPPERGNRMFTRVYPYFHHKYPNIVVNVIETNVREQQKLVARGDLDIGFVTLTDEQKTGDDYTLICDEELLLAVPSFHPACAEAVTDDAGKYPFLPLSRLMHEPFALMHKKSTIYPFVDQIFRQEKIVPNILFETSRATTIMDIVNAGMCCGIVPDSDVLAPASGVSLFCLPSHPAWHIMSLTRKGSYLNHPAKYFILLATMYWQKQLPEWSSADNIPEDVL